MFSSSPLFYSSALVFLILISNNVYCAKSEDGGSNYGDIGSIVPPPSPPTDQSACNNCTICQYPNCHPQPPPTYTPPPSGDQQPYAAPPPPSSGQVNCPPAAPVTCCGGGGGQYYPPPAPFYYPYNNYSGAAAPMRLSPLTKPGSYVSTWPPAVLFYFTLLFVFH